MHDDSQQTMQFHIGKEGAETIQDVLLLCFQALKEKGYDPINQLVGYIISGDPTYITSYNNARAMIRRYERDELLEEVLKFYMHNNTSRG